MPQQRLTFAQEDVSLEVPDGSAWVRRSLPASVVNVRAATHAALREPLDFPPLGRCFTPDDRVTVIIREEINGLVPVLIAVLEELQTASVSLEAITLLCPPRLFCLEPVWHAELPPAFQQIPVVVHDPADQLQLAYLANTDAGRRVYLNKLVVDADQLIILGRARYDPSLEYSGGLSDLFPALSDEATRTEFLLKPTEALQGKRAWPVRQEVDEVGWLLGMPFLVQVLEGTGDDVVAVVAGSAAAVGLAMRAKLKGQDRVAVRRTADLVIATLNGDPRRQIFAEVSQAFANANRIVAPGGRIVVLSRSQGELGPGSTYYRQAENPIQALALVRKHKTPDMVSWWHVTLAASRASLYLLGGWPSEVVEELFMVPLDHPGQVQKLIDEAELVTIFPDANRVQAVVEK